jgi:hypothetical protein
MNQNLWGPHLWNSLHTMSLVYPLRPTEEDKKNYKNFFTSLQYVIPCSICKKNYMRHLKEHPIDNFLENRKTLFEWVVDIHNLVNVETGKKPMSYDIALKKYGEVYKKNIDLLSERDINYDDEKKMNKKGFDNSNSCNIEQPSFDEKSDMSELLKLNNHNPKIIDNYKYYQNNSYNYNFYFLYFLLTIVIILLFINLIPKKYKK